MAGKKDIVEQALKLVMGVGEKAAPKAAVRAYHVSPHDFDVFKPSEFRGSTFFSSTPERAKRGAEAGRNEMVMETATELPSVNWRTYEVEVDPSRIKGLSLTPSESKWFEGLPEKIVGDDALAEATRGIPPGMYWDDFYDEAPITEGVYEYTKKASPPSMSYENAINKNRDIYRQQWPHYAGSATDEKASASRLSEQGMGGYLVQDEGGLSFAINDPSVVKILRKYADGGRIAKDNGGEVDPYAEEIASAKRLLEEKTYDDQSWSDWAGDAAENAIRTARSILPTALGGEGDVGISDIVRGAYEAGKDAVTFPGDVITGKQALFDEAGRPLENAVARSFNTASTIGGASSAIPVPDNSLRVFGGVKSLTADKAAMLDAMKMESKGATPDEIWDNTGWFRGADGRWRYEIPDIGTTVNSAALQLDLSRATIPSVKAAKLGDYLQHPEFFAAYPQFKDMDVRTMPSTSSYGGMYFPRFAPGWGGVTDPRIELNENLLSSGASQRDVLLHEIQHAIQQKEGFAPGTNIQAQAAGRANPKFERYNIAIQSDPDMQKLLKIQNSAEYKAEKREADAFFEYETKPKLLEINNSSLSEKEKIEAIDRISAEYRAEKEKIAPLINEVERLSSVVSAKNIPLRQPKEFFTPTEAYQHYAGETESRNVQNRQNMAREELRGSRPWETQDYPYIDQLFPENDVTWKLGYASGGEVDDDDIDDAIRIAKDVGGSTPVLMEDAKGNKYDAQGNIIPPISQTGASHISDPTLERKGMMDEGEPVNYETEVKPFIDVATSPMNWAVESPDSYSGFPLGIGTVQTEGPSLLDTMKIATQLAASGQPTEDRGEYNWGQSREKAIRRFVGAPEGGEETPYRGPFSYNPSDTANFVNTLIGFSPVGWGELFHDIPYEAGRTGDYGTAAYEGGLNALLSAPGIAALGLAGRAALNAIRKNPKLAAAGAAAATGAGSYFLPDDAEADPNINKALSLTSGY